MCYEVMCMCMFGVGFSQCQIPKSFRVNSFLPEFMCLSSKPLPPREINLIGEETFPEPIKSMVQSLCFTLLSFFPCCHCLCHPLPSLSTPFLFLLKSLVGISQWTVPSAFRYLPLTGLQTAFESPLGWPLYNKPLTLVLISSS